MADNPPACTWPIGSRVTIVDAWGNHPTAGKVTRHIGDDQVVVEDGHGVIHCCKTWRIVRKAPSAEALAAMFD